jgi:pilus assembly protein Flp/PilA
MSNIVLRAMAWANAWERDEEGQGLTEYGLILALIAILCVAALTGLKDAIVGVLDKVAGALG